MAANYVQDDWISDRTEFSSLTTSLLHEIHGVLRTIHEPLANCFTQRNYSTGNKLISIVHHLALIWVGAYQKQDTESNFCFLLQTSWRQWRDYFCRQAIDWCQVYHKGKTASHRQNLNPTLNIRSMLFNRQKGFADNTSFFWSIVYKQALIDMISTLYYSGWEGCTAGPNNYVMG